jgi:hypothetical protein
MNKRKIFHFDPNEANSVTREELVEKIKQFQKRSRPMVDLKPTHNDNEIIVYRLIYKGDK